MVLNPWSTFFQAPRTERQGAGVALQLRPLLQGGGTYFGDAKGQRVWKVCPCRWRCPAAHPRLTHPVSGFPPLDPAPLPTPIATDCPGHPGLSAHPPGLGVGEGKREGWIPGLAEETQFRGLRGPGEHTAESHALRQERAGGRSNAAEWRYLLAVAMVLLHRVSDSPGGGAMGGSSSEAAHWPPGRHRPCFCRGWSLRGHLCGSAALLPGIPSEF